MSKDEQIYKLKEDNEKGFLEQVRDVVNQPEEIKHIWRTLNDQSHEMEAMRMAMETFSSQNDRISRLEAWVQVIKDVMNKHLNSLREEDIDHFAVFLNKGKIEDYFVDKAKKDEAEGKIVRLKGLH